MIRKSTRQVSNQISSRSEKNINMYRLAQGLEASREQTVFLIDAGPAMHDQFVKLRVRPLRDEVISTVLSPNLKPNLANVKIRVQIQPRPSHLLSSPTQWTWLQII